MVTSDQVPTGPVHVRADEHHANDRGGAVTAIVRAPIGPRAPVDRLGPLTLVQDRVVPAGAVVDTEPRATRRLYYLVAGALTVENGDGGRTDLQAGDLGVVSGAVESGWTERNDSDVDARAWVLEYPSADTPSPQPEVVRNGQMARLAPGGAFETTLVLDRGDARIGGAVFEFADTRLEVGATLPIELEEGQSAVLWCLDGRLQIDVDGAEPVSGVGVDDAVLIPPAPVHRQVRVASQAASHVLHAVTGDRERLAAS